MLESDRYTQCSNSRLRLTDDRLLVLPRRLVLERLARLESELDGLVQYTDVEVGLGSEEGGEWSEL